MTDHETSYYLSPIDGHDHFTKKGRSECAVCRLEVERDRYKQLFIDANKDRRFAWNELKLENERAVDLKIERDRLRALLTQTVNEGEWVMVAPTVHADLLAERDRLRPVAVAAQALLALLDANPIGEYGDAVCEAIDTLDAKLTAALDQRGVRGGEEEAT